MRFFELFLWVLSTDHPQLVYEFFLIPPLGKRIEKIIDILALKRLIYLFT